jgi:hypothetical protein
MNHSLLISKSLVRGLAYMSKRSEELISQNNACIQSLRDTILISDRTNLLFLKEYLTEFTKREMERDFKNNLIALYLQMIEEKLNNNPIC